MVTLVKASIENQLHRLLTDRIVNLTIEPGTRIDVAGLAKEYAVSETPIRIALTKLAREGLVKSIPRGGYFAIKLNLKEIQDIYDLRILLESYAIDRVAENVDLKEMKAILDGLCRLRGMKDEEKKARESLALDVLFHMKLVSGCGNKKVQEVFDQIYNLVRMCQNMHGRIAADITEHISIVEALINKKKAEAQGLLVLHLKNARDDLLEVLSKKVPSM